MHKSPNPPIENVAGGDFRGRDHEIILLNKKEWSYVRRRYNLTPREFQIAELICQGLRNSNIAKHLHISPGTVKTHTRNIYRKTHVKSKIAMLLRFITDARVLYFQHDRAHSIHTAD